MQHSLFLSPLFILHKTIRCETIRNHMHCAGLHNIQIPTIVNSPLSFVLNLVLILSYEDSRFTLGECLG